MKYLTKEEIEQIKSQHPTATVKIITSYGEEIQPEGMSLQFIAARYTPHNSTLTFMADAKKIERK